MNLETQIKPELWNAISSSYSPENYSHAIRDAMVVITEILRDKSGLDGDGDALAGRALGFGDGKPPLIKVNKLQTQTEQDIQKGLLLVLKGMYAFVRNPRSHERLDDSRETADAIILFVNYLLGFLGASQQSFTIQDFIAKVIEPHFVKDDEYIEGLVNTIPVRKRNDTLVALYREKNWARSDNISLVVKAILSKLADDEKSDFFQIVSDELQRTSKHSEVTLIIKVVSGEYWPRLQRMPRLRAEFMLTQSLDDAWYTPADEKTNSPESTWIHSLAAHYLRKDSLQETILKKLSNADFDYHNFVVKYLIYVLPSIFEGNGNIQGCVKAIARCIRVGNDFVKDRVVEFLRSEPPREWFDQFVKELNDLTDQENPEVYLPADGIFSEESVPFLGKFVPQQNPANPSVPEDEMPF